jgi:hypothetical protein
MGHDALAGPVLVEQEMVGRLPTKDPELGHPLHVLLKRGIHGQRHQIEINFFPINIISAVYSVANLGFLSQIPDQNFSYPGSLIGILSIPDPEFLPIPDPGSKRHRIPDHDPQHWLCSV